MISRISIGALVMAAAIVALSTVTAPAMAQSWIRSTGVHPEYNPQDAAYGAGMGRHLPVVMFDERRSASTSTMERAVAIGMRGVEGPPPSLAQAMIERFRVVWTFDDGWWSTTDVCKRSPLQSYVPPSSSSLIPAVVRRSLRVSATLCRGEAALSQVVGFTSKSPDTKSPRFIAFIGDMTSALFPSASGARERR